MKELPTPRGEPWYIEGKKPSRRLYIEIGKMENYFNLGKLRTISPIKTNWDIDSFDIKPHVLRLHPIKDRSYPLGWDVQFSMDDNGYLSKQKQVWTIKLFYPSNYPYQAPVRTLLDDKGHVLYGDKNEGTISIEGMNYLRACLFTSRKHNPGTDHAAVYAARSILWLRSCLYSKKKGVLMPDYV